MTAGGRDVLGGGGREASGTGRREEGEGFRERHVRHGTEAEDEVEGEGGGLAWDQTPNRIWRGVAEEERPHLSDCGAMCR